MRAQVEGGFFGGIGHSVIEAAAARIHDDEEILGNVAGGLGEIAQTWADGIEKWFCDDFGFFVAALMHEDHSLLGEA